MRIRIYVLAFMLVGLIAFSAFAAEKVVKIGAFAPLTGPYVDIGTQIANGIKLAVKLANEQGGIEIAGEMYPIELVWGDTESKVEVALSVIDKLITVDHIDVAVGFLHSHIFIPAMDKFQAYHVPVVDAAAASKEIYKKIAEKGMDYIFQESPTTDDIAKAVSAAVYYYLKPTKIALANENTDAGRDFGSIAREWYEVNAPEVEVVYEGYTTPGATEFTAELAKIKASGAEVIIGEVYGASASAYTGQWYEMRVSALPAWMGATTNSQTFIDEHKKEMEGVIVNNRWWPGPYTPISESRIQAYEQEYGTSPTNFAIQGHDAALIAIEAIDHADSLDKRDIRAQLDLGSFVAIWGVREFTPLEEGHRCPTAMVVVQIQDGKKIPVWPLDLAEALPGEWMPVPPWPWEK